MHIPLTIFHGDLVNDPVFSSILSAYLSAYVEIVVWESEAKQAGISASRGPGPALMEPEERWVGGEQLLPLNHILQKQPLSEPTYPGLRGHSPRLPERGLYGRLLATMSKALNPQPTPL